MSRSRMAALTGVVFVLSLAARPSLVIAVPSVFPSLSAFTPTTQSAYAGAEACKDCHGPVYAAWSRTKHANALSKLQAANREGGTCIGCHVTGSPEMIAAEGSSPSHPNVQCEACHGPARSHVDAAVAGDAGNARTARIEERTCVRCHNETSPHYKPFFYKAMVGLVHR
jgi:hypothetical protein